MIAAAAGARNMNTTIDTKFTDGGCHYRLEVADGTVRLRLRCQRRWYLVACSRLSRSGTPVGSFPWELRGIVRELIAEHRNQAVISEEASRAAA
jgi:hypothetical protein